LSNSRVENAIVWFVEGEFNIISNEFANQKAAPVTHDEARRVVQADSRRTRAVAFAMAL
jgi:hypothetical protein